MRFVRVAVLLVMIGSTTTVLWPTDLDVVGRVLVVRMMAAFDGIVFFLVVLDLDDDDDDDATAKKDPKVGCRAVLVVLVVGIG